MSKMMLGSLLGCFLTMFVQTRHQSEMEITTTQITTELIYEHLHILVSTL